MKQRRVITPWRGQPGHSHVLLALSSRIEVHSHVWSVREADCVTGHACPSQRCVPQDTTVLRGPLLLDPVLQALTLTSLVATLCSTVVHARLVGTAAEPVSLSLRVSVTRDTTAPLEPPLPLQWLWPLAVYVLQGMSVHMGLCTPSSTRALWGPGAALWEPKTFHHAGPALQDSTATVLDSASPQESVMQAITVQEELRLQCPQMV
ncbi:uncharacterized protein LOC125888319 [Epinephelus fuscoguttatus]|uniref:uncharacterized protein LOC125888319 n=1 Tax=Epinephelus fuscoguttatus TaxID=293821 RepID=UPI0020D0C7DB|nr:uncharacterized protein LOC125888319 [Epinephelus fuscoguttatus]